MTHDLLAAAPTVLVVEAPRVTSLRANAVLRAAGCSVLVAAAGPEALRLAAEYLPPIHLAVIDVRVPELGGNELADRIRERHPEARPLYLSDHDCDWLVARGVIRAGVPFLQRPFLPVVLLAGVWRALEEEQPEAPWMDRAESGAVPGDLAGFRCDRGQS